MQLGFVIDQTRCIGCHACTVACKSENHVPLGSFRTWVKYTEQGEFPAVKRSFSVLRCNQCSAAPCVTICPVRALEKRADGIVDVDQKACIGCKACMQGCPYDALYIHPASGTAQKCHFCAHRTERGLAPACAVVCPTEAILPGDFDDPTSLVSRLRDSEQLIARKPEAGTAPNVLYRLGMGASSAGLDPLQTQSSGGYLWAEVQEGLQHENDRFRAAEDPSLSRTSYDVEHPPLWGWKVSAYLWTKSLAAGVGLALCPVFFALPPSAGQAALLALCAILFLLLTTVLLVADLKRPERFLFVLTRPNWTSWLAKGTLALIAYGAMGALWAACGWWGWEHASGRAVLAVPTLCSAALAACYTAFLFAQAKGRVLWMQRMLWLHLIAQAYAAGSGLLILLQPLLGLAEPAIPWLHGQLAAGLIAHLAFSLSGKAHSPSGREAEYAQAWETLVHGPLRQRYRLALAVAGAALVLALLGLLAPGALASLGAAALALLAIYLYEDAFVRAGQALRIS